MTFILPSAFVCKIDCVNMMYLQLQPISDIIRHFSNCSRDVVEGWRKVLVLIEVGELWVMGQRPMCFLTNRKPHY